MIRVEIYLDDNQIGRIDFHRIESPHKVEENWATYEVKYAIERGTGVGMHKRVLYGFPRKYYNAFALVHQALDLLHDKDFRLERDFDPDETPVSADMAREQHRTLPALQAWVSKLRNN